ncbi:6,7-dimethyl-8-ribityllumazine synthase [Gilvibacter sp. SZ-19]|jgi:6,7-dimethyl-8-ribityllumazine synthase|uniref:6,7-dimethyl-8-ribityllumazine synthase n=1 Tax=unclassified Gilvibacter TaxID=2625242 RepID=UPI000B3CAFD4|nr:6,7-dimethyl-8-ribityllumazine synthase [Gilvibacter sp. SZ-19]ARV11063.1 6,7-dimethyl-8-ribityllumazine synthase [Gilvibacter sp. SZ-19]
MATAGNNLSAYNKAEVPNAKDFRFGLVVSKWNSEITEGLFQGAFDALKDCGAINDNIVRWNVPGSYELIYGAQRMRESYDMLDAVIVIGSVIQGETKHFDFVCQGVTNGIAQLNAAGGIPVIFCVLTDNNMQQAIDRSGGKHGNKGTEAAIAAIEMAQLRKESKF